MLDLSIMKINGELGRYGSDIITQSWEMQRIYIPSGHGAMAAGLPWAIPAVYPASAQGTLPIHSHRDKNQYGSVIKTEMEF